MAGERIRICGKGELPREGQAAEYSAGDRMICVANLQGSYSALDNVCLHRGGPLGQGYVEGQNIVCPWHGWQFDLKTGAVEHDSTKALPSYSIFIQGEDVFVEI